MLKGAPRLLPNALPTPGPELHIPVLPDEVRELLAVRPGDTVVASTFGGAGHAALLADDLHGRGHFVAIDRDPDATPQLEAFAHSLPTGVELSVLRNSFARALEELAEDGFRADAILFDLGVSSMQLDQPERGFSYATDAPLDMRMDPHVEPSAADLVNEWSEADLARTFTRYGEERFARPIARAIVRRRAERPFLRTLDLVDTVRGAIPTPARFGQGHPAKRVFQALRIAVNDELTELEEGLESAIEICEVGGRIAVISFHSLEDRIVKHRFREAAHGCICPPDLPVCGCGRSPEFRVVNSRVIRPSEAELARNPRAASGRLRVAQREVAA
jgi:16S rRNA (cytosine1402-N4)-methyltransferase